MGPLPLMVDESEEPWKPSVDNAFVLAWAIDSLLTLSFPIHGFLFFHSLALSGVGKWKKVIKSSPPRLTLFINWLLRYYVWAFLNFRACTINS